MNIDDKPIPVLYNPVAGRGRAARKVARLSEFLTGAGVPHDLIASDAEGDLEDKVLRIVNDGAAGVIVAGGDGSIHEVVNGLLRADNDAALGVVPVGTGNDFAKACGIPLHWEDAARLLVDRLHNGVPPRPVDAGRVNDRYFANGAGIGFDAKVNHLARDIRLPIGDVVYLLAVLRGLWDGVITPDVRLAYDDSRRDGPITIANFSNGPWVGGMFHIAPMARNDDGVLDLVLAAPVSRARILALLPKLIRGTHIGEAEVTHARITRCELVATVPVPSHLDGEVQPLQTRFEIEVLEGALALL